MDRKETCAETLRRRVLQLVVTPGEVLEETALSSEFGLSRTPVREILQQLVGEGYLTHEARSTVVSRMDLGTMRSFFQTAPLMYATVARLAAENRTRAGVDDLSNIQATFRAGLEACDADATVMANHAFHAQIAEMADNSYLMPSICRLLIDHTRMGQRFYRPRTAGNRDRIDLAASHHDEIIEAISARDSEAAVEVTLKHWDLSRNELEKYVSPDPLPLDIPNADARSPRQAGRHVEAV